jgi:hypothetical protein
MCLGFALWLTLTPLHPIFASNGIPGDRKLGDDESSNTVADVSQAITALQNLLADSGFESGTPNSYWTDYSATFGTSICSSAICDSDDGTAFAHSGTYWVWFGGAVEGDEAYVSQSVIIPADAGGKLSFWIMNGACGDGGASSYTRLLVDETELWRTDGSDSTCGTTQYRQVEIDLAAFADNAAHTIKFDNKIIGEGNFSLDDVYLYGGHLIYLPLVSK